MSELDHDKNKSLAVQECSPLPAQHGAADSANHALPTTAAVCPTYSGESPSEQGFDHPILRMGQMYGLETPQTKTGVASLLFGLALGTPGKAYQDLVKALDGWKIIQRNWPAMVKVLDPLIMATRLLLHSTPAGKTIAELTREVNAGTHNDNRLMDNLFKREVTDLLKRIETAAKAVQEERLKK